MCGGVGANGEMQMSVQTPLSGWRGKGDGAVQKRDACVDVCGGRSIQLCGERCGWVQKTWEGIQLCGERGENVTVCKEM